MARVTFVDAIDTVRGALDEVKDGQAKRARLVCKWHYWGEKWIDEDGSKVHLVYMYHFHEGAWSEGATRNREMIKASFLPAAHTTCELLRRWVCGRRGNGMNGYNAARRAAQNAPRCLARRIVHTHGRGIEDCS